MKRTIPAYEKLGIFYLGKEVDPGTGQLTDDLFLYKKIALSWQCCLTMFLPVPDLNSGHRENLWILKNSYTQKQGNPECQSSRLRISTMPRECSL